MKLTISFFKVDFYLSNEAWYLIVFILINTLSLGISLIALGLWISFPYNVNFMYSVILIITLALAQVIDQVDMSWVDPRFTVFLTAFLKEF